MRWLLALLLSSSLLLGGCATLVAPLSDQPLDRDHGDRTFGAFIEDASIEHKIRVNLIRELPDKDNSRIVVVSFNGNVLLAGEARSQSIKTQAKQIAKRVRHVVHVYNALQLRGNISMLTRISDAWLTSKIKLGLLFSGSTPGSRTKVITENGVVYLMGLLSHEEATKVVSKVQNASGVQKIFKIIEYTD